MTDLDRLSALAGIEPFHHDMLGTRYEIPEATKAAILAALGLPAGDGREAAASLALLQERPWRRLCGPAHVVPAEAQPGLVRLTLPAGRPGAAVVWRLLEEGGAVREGRTTAGQLAVAARRTVDGEDLVQGLLALPAGLPEGYHRLEVEVAQGGLPAAEATVIVAPRRCWGPSDVVAGARMWGLSCQLYALVSAENWGIGDYGDLARLAEGVAAAGGDAVGLNPLHALHLVEPDRASPYSPASRDFLNVLNIDVDAVPDFAESAEAQALAAEAGADGRLGAARQGELVDYAAVAALALPVLAACHRSFRRRHLVAATGRARDFAAFRRERGRPLEVFAVFMALQEHFAGGDPALFSWWTWPEGLRHPDGPDVAAFVAENEERVEFHLYLQWVADRQLMAAAAAGRAEGLRIGLYRDLAVGVGPASAAAWSHPNAIVRGLSVGAPPDLLNRLGQNWGLSPINPLVLEERAFAPFVNALRANMRHAGALRIDHVMGLMHLYWVPDGLPPVMGAYVAYPFQDLLRVLALESRRHRCLVIGEDLGTVPEGFRPALEEAGVLSYKVMMFERVGQGLFRRPRDYPAEALVTAGTHDVATVCGFWRGRDLEWRRALGHYPSEASRDDEAAGRIADRRRLIDALIDAGVWPADPPTDCESHKADLDLQVAVHRFLAATPCRLMMVQVEDALMQVEQVNLPGTIDDHPNWRRRLPVPLERLFADEGVARLLAALRSERPR